MCIIILYNDRPTSGKEVDWVFKKHKTVYQLKDHGVFYGAFYYV